MIEVKEGYVVHIKKDYWGSSILIMQKEGKAFCRTYYYEDDIDSIYFDWLSVNVEDRKNGIGTELLKIHEEIALQLCAKTSYLWVKTDSWMHDWYTRKGYQDYKDYEHEENAVWMKKALFVN
jgi:hypothetical protein